MRNNKKSKKNNDNNLDKLKMILDKGTAKNLSSSEDGKYLKSLSKTLKKSAEENTVQVKIISKIENNEEKHSLKPKVTVHPRTPLRRKEKIETKVEIKTLEKQVTYDEENIYGDEDFFEVEKVEISEPRFMEVKPKETVKPEKKRSVEKKAIADENLIEWKPVEEKVEERKTEPEIKEEETLAITTVEEKKEIVPAEKIVEEPVEAEKTEKISEEIKERDEKINAFKDLESIDDETAILLYDHGFTSIDALSIASTKDLTRIGIKRRQAKKIKREIKEKIEWKPWEFEEEIEGETGESKEEKKVEVVESISIGETAEGEVTAEQIEEEKENRFDEVKYDVFKDLESVDRETAVLLYDNGYTSVDELKNATVKDLTRIKGIKRRTAKKIIREINKKLEESVKVKPIDVEGSAESDVSEEKIKEEEEDKVVEEEIPAPVELSSKSSEWKPVEAEKTEKISEEIKERDEKINAFKDLESIDDETAILLYDHGFTSIDALSIASTKDLTRIGIKRRQAKKIKREIEEKKFIEEESKKDQIVDEELTGEYFIEEEEDIGESIELDEKILEHVEPEEHMEEFFEEETTEEIPLPVGDENVAVDDVFKDIPSIDEKIAKLLIENGITSIETLKNKTIKELTKIKGIRRKIAKQIKKEVEGLAEKNISPVNESYERDENPYIKEEEDEEEEWESFDEEKLSEEKIEEIKGFRHGDYTLYEREIETKDNKKQVVRFFSKAEPEGARPIELPEGYEVKENTKTGVPYLKKRRKK